ncbi:MAG: hypothetical protein KDH15_05725 [Rhodocyclaceae bacterium]|nr:hypothetical protein [Rhodocyclaceae bacterium]
MLEFKRLRHALSSIVCIMLVASAVGGARLVQAHPIRIGVSAGNPKASVDIRITSKGGPNVLQNLSFDRTKSTGAELDRVADILKQDDSVKVERSSKTVNGEKVEILTITPVDNKKNYSNATWNYVGQPKEQPFRQFGVTTVSKGPGRSSIEFGPGGQGAYTDLIDWTVFVVNQDLEVVTESSLLDIANSISADELASLFASSLAAQGLDVSAANGILTLDSAANDFFYVNVSGEPRLLFQVANSPIPSPGTIALLGLGLAALGAMRIEKRFPRPAREGSERFRRDASWPFARRRAKRVG